MWLCVTLSVPLTLTGWLHIILGVLLLLTVLVLRHSRYCIAAYWVALHHLRYTIATHWGN